MTNETPHARFFGFQNSSVPSWLLEREPVLMKHQVRSNKTDPLVDEVDLLQATPNYARVHYPDGRKTTVATKHLVPKNKLTSNHYRQRVVLILYLFQ